MTERHFPFLPLSFYEQSDILRCVRRAAFARITSPDAVLACLLTRVSASIDPAITLPNRGTLDFISAIVGESGTGKSVAFRAARDLLPDIGTPVDGWGIGSGQGIVKTIAGKADDNGVCHVVNPRVLFLADEGEQLLKISRQEQSITMATIRTAWSGGALGQTNADADRSRNVAAGAYRFAMTVGLQPTFAADLLTGVNAGDPQRFLFVGVTHPEQPDILPLFPDPMLPLWLPRETATELTVDPEVIRQIVDYRVKKQRRDIPGDPLDSHRHLLTLKIAGLLAWAHNDDVSVQWWNMASQIVEVSRQICDRVRDLVLIEQQSKVTAKAESEVVLRATINAAHERDVMESMIRTIGNKARNEGRPVNASTLQQATASKHRLIVPFDDALTEAVRRGEIVALSGGKLYTAPTSRN